MAWRVVVTKVAGVASVEGDEEFRAGSLVRVKVAVMTVMAEPRVAVVKVAVLGVVVMKVAVVVSVEGDEEFRAGTSVRVKVVGMTVTADPRAAVVTVAALRVVVTKLSHAPHSASVRTYTGTGGASLAAASAQQKPRARVERRGMAERRAWSGWRVEQAKSKVTSPQILQNSGS